jgi:heme-degrading monooxygenase HmoA
MNPSLIARTWRGATRTADADDYVRYLGETGFREYLATPGNRGVLGLRRLDGERAEFLLISLWESLEAIRGFAGDDIRSAVFYPADQRFLIERDDQATHFEVVHYDMAAAPPLTALQNAQPLTTIAPEISRKRLLVEGYFTREMNREVLIEFFEHLTRELGLRTYGDPIVHRTSGEGKEANEGFDAFVPLVDSGIYIAAWVQPRFLSTVIYTCADFDQERAVVLVRDFFGLGQHQAAVF